METLKITETFTNEQTLEAAQAACPAAADNFKVGYTADDGAWFYPILYGTAQGFAAQVQTSEGWVRHVGMYIILADAAVAVHEAALAMLAEWPETSWLEDEDESDC